MMLAGQRILKKWLTISPCTITTDHDAIIPVP